MFEIKVDHRGPAVNAYGVKGTEVGVLEGDIIRTSIFIFKTLKGIASYSAINVVMSSLTNNISAEGRNIVSMVTMLDDDILIDLWIAHDGSDVSNDLINDRKKEVLAAKISSMPSDLSGLLSKMRNGFNKHKEDMMKDGVCDGDCENCNEDEK